MSAPPPTLWAARVRDAKTWHLTWRTDSEARLTTAACGLRVEIVQWAEPTEFISQPDGHRCPLCLEMAHALFVRHVDWHEEQAQVELAPGVLVDVPELVARPPAQMPRTVKVGPYRYDLAVDVEAVREFGRQRDGDYAAYSAHAALQIRLSDVGPDGERTHPQALRAAALHEALHCAIHVSGWQPEAAIAAGEGGVEEYTVRALEATLLGLVRDNPGLMAWLAQ